MANVYDVCPSFESDRWLLRLTTKEDSEELLSVYSDKNALPFFNSDNCHGDNFYYPTRERMDSAIDFWIYSYGEGYFVRWTIIDKKVEKAVGTIELFHRESDGNFGEVGVLRLDLGSAYEREDTISEILSIIIEPAYELFDCDEIISKVPIYAVERIEAFSKFGFTKSEVCLNGLENKKYYDYWIVKK